MNLHEDLNRPINMFDLEQERIEASNIIQNANQKAKEIKEKLKINKNAPALIESEDGLIHIQD